MLRFLLLRKEKSTSCKIFFFLKKIQKHSSQKEELLHNLLIYDKALSITVDMEKKK